MSYNELVNLIKSVIAANNSQRITGNVLQNVLLNILDTLYNSGHSGGTNLEELTVQNDATFHGNVTIDGILTVLNKIIASLADIDILNSKNITTEYLLVTKAAHFFQLIIDQLRANKGAIIISGGQCVVDYWEPIRSNNATTGYKVYYRSEDGNTENARAVHQSFLVGDQVICQSLGGDGIKVGTNDNITTTYYWRLVTSVSTTPTATKNDGSYIDEGHNLHHWIIMSNTGSPSSTGNYDAANNNVTPNIGDEIIQLGYRGSALTGNELKARQCAIVISAYPTKDSDLIPPSLAFYQNINTFALGSANRGTYADATGAYFKGKLVSSDGTLIDINPDGFNADVEYYQLVPNESPIIKPETSKTVTFRVLYVKNGDGKILTSSEMQNLYVKVNNGNYIAPVSGSNYFPVTVTSGTLDIGVALYLRNPTDDTYTLKDQYVTTIVDLGSVTNGVDGRYHQYIYQNSASQPARPTSSTASIPSGWSETASTPSAGLYIWRSERVVTPTGSGVLYGDWSAPVRLSGIDGIDGEDGIPGEDGVDAESWALLPSKEIFEVRIDANSQDYKNMKLENIIGILYTDLQYQVAHIVGDDVTIMSELTGYSIVITSDNVLPLRSNSATVNGSGSNVLRWPSSDNANHNWLAVTNPSSVDYQDYYYLHSNGLIDYMPISLNVALKYNNKTLASHVVKLVFNADHIFAALEDGLISIYQGLSGDNSGVNWRTGFSQIRQTWEQIRLSVSNIDNLQIGGTLQNTDYEQYIYRKMNDTTTVPAAPTESDTIGTTNTAVRWTTYATMNSTSGYPRIYFCKRTRSLNSSTWGSWSTPRLFKYWDGAKEILAYQIVNNATLDIKANEIKSEVTQRLNDNYYSKSEIDQTAENISLSVTQKTSGNKNYLKQPSFTDESLFNANWKYQTADINAVTLIHSAWRGASNITSPQTVVNLINDSLSSKPAITYTLPSKKSAVLSSYFAVPAKSSSIKAEARQNVVLTEDEDYTFSAWVKRSLNVQNKSCVIALGFYNASGMSITRALAFKSDGITVDDSVIVSPKSASNIQYVEFTLNDDDWHQICVEVFVSTTATYQAWIGTWGAFDFFREVFVSRPLLCNGAGLPSSNYNYLSYAKYRMYGYTGITNLLLYADFASTSDVYAWITYISADGKALLWDGSSIVSDAVSEEVLNQQWSLTEYPSAVQIANTLAAVAFNNTTGYRVSSASTLKQSFDKEFANTLKDEWFVFSVYVKKRQNWSNIVYKDNTALPALLMGIRGTNINNITPGADDDSITFRDIETVATNDYLQRFAIPVDDASWHRVWWKFKLDSINALINGFDIGLHTNVNSYGIGEDWLVSRPKLELGEAPSMWTDNNDDVTEGLKRAGIDIGNGKIRLDAENTEVTGNLLTQGDASFGGIIKAATLYSPFIDINFDSSNVYVINPRNGSNYITSCRFFTNTNKSIALPDASAYGGLQLRIYGMPPLSRPAVTLSRAYIVYTDGKIFYPIADANDRLLSFTDIIEPFEGSMITMISLFSEGNGLGWYVLSGKFYVNGTLIEI